MIENGIGGANTRTGLIFEGKTDLKTFLSLQKNYFVNDKDEVFYKNNLVAYLFKKNNLYKFLEKNGVKWSDYLSKRLLPDDCIFVIIKNTIYIIECKFQKVAGSVDEKLQTCDFKKKQYKKLFSRLNMEVEYIYLISNWFRHASYRDVLDYIISVGCSYYFEYIPLDKIGLIVPELD